MRVCGFLKTGTILVAALGAGAAVRAGGYRQVRVVEDLTGPAEDVAVFVFIGVPLQQRQQFEFLLRR